MFSCDAKRDTTLTDRVIHVERELELAIQRISQLESSLDQKLTLPPLDLTQSAPPPVGATEEKEETPSIHVEEVAEEEEEEVVDDRPSRKTSSLRHASTRLTEMAAARPGHEIKPTCWEASLLIGEEYVGASGSFFLSLGMVLSVLIALGFLYVLMFTPQNFVNSNRADDDTILRWRYMEGHHQKNIVGSRSLISVLCDRSKEPFLTQATDQLKLYNYMSSYADAEDGSFFLGCLLAMLVEMMWLLLVCQELQECLAFMSAVLCLERSSTTDIAFTIESHIVINTISPSRFGFVLALSALRMIVGIGLWIAGALWLAAEINIEDLVLNAAALHFILDVDEMLYCHFAPDVVKVIIGKGIKLPAGFQHRRWKNLNARPAVMLSVAILVSSLVFSLLVWPHTEGILTAQDIMCGGDTDFVYIDLDFFPQRATTEATSSQNVMSPTSNFHVDFLQRYAHRSSSSQQTWLHVAELQQAVEAGAPSLYPRRCEDHPDLHEVELRLDVVDFVPFFQAFSGRADAVSCESLADLCYATNSFWVRFLCPVTCGCNIYPGPLWVRKGCPQTCEENQFYWDQEDGVPCKDPNKTELQNDAVWISWWVGNWTPWYTAQWPQGFAAQHVPGCEILAGDEAGLLPELLCAHGMAAGFSGSVRMFCPETCGCRGGELEGCPHQCDMRMEKV